MVEAARATDERQFMGLAREALDERSWADVAETLLFPVLRRLGDEWAASLITPGCEHFASQLILRLCHAVIADTAEPAEEPRLLLACPEVEGHEIGLLALVPLLRERGLGTIYLGPTTPTHDLLSLPVRGRRAICLSATTGAGGVSAVRAARLLAGSPSVTHVYLAGPALHSNSGRRTRFEATDRITLLSESLADAAATLASGTARS